MTNLPINRDLPQNPEAERSVLGSVLIRPSSLDEVVGFLGADDFLGSAHRCIYAAMVGLAKAGDVVDVITISEELRKRGELGRLEGEEVYLLGLSNAVPTAENARHYGKIVRDLAVLRRVIATCVQAASRAHGDVESSELLADLRSELAALETTQDGGPQRLGDGLDEAMDMLERKTSEPEKYSVLSGIREFDRTIGGHKAGQLIVVAARPGGGKTSHALSTAIRVATTQIPALVFSLEMSRQELTERAIAFSARVTGSRLTNGDLDYDAWGKIRNSKKALGPIPLWLDVRNHSCGALCAEARRWRARFTQGQRALVVIDYLGLVRSSDRSQNRAIEVGAMSRAFKQLAKDLDCPVMLVAQLNRESVKGDGPARRPKLSDLRDSGEIEQDADMVIFPFREGEGDQASGPAQGPVDAELIVAKHRNGPTGIVEVDWDGRFMAFYDRASPHRDDDERVI
jgi:replicative DNA helicase